MLSLRVSAWMVLALVASSAGCKVPLPKGKSPLRPPQMSADTCVLEVFFVRFPFGDSQANVRLWEEIDEQHFPAELRRRLAGNGFRAGMVGGQMPMELSRLLELQDKPVPKGDANQVSVADLESDPRVVRRHLPIRFRGRKEIVASGVYEELPVLICESGRLCGQTYAQAQGLLAVKAFALSDGRVDLEIVPELHYGKPRQRWVGDQGSWRLEAGRRRRAFSDMQLKATLAPGSMLILSSLPNRTATLGHHFFTEGDAELEQKLLVIRLAQTQHDGLFSPSPVLDLDE